MAGRYTHIDTACGLIEFHGWRLVTDPVFDPPGRWYWFGWGTGARKRSTPALSPEALGDADAVLLSHDQHSDNLDSAGRRWLAGRRRVITTAAAARRLGRELAGSRAASGTLAGRELIGLAPGERVVLTHPSAPRLHVEAVRAQHRPRWVPETLSGPVIGFLVWVDGAPSDLLYVTGDTVLTPEMLRMVGERRPRAIVCHTGAVAFPYLLGRARFSLTADQAAILAGRSGAESVIAIHNAGWSHFVEGREALLAAFAARGSADRLVEYRSGEPVEF